MKEIKQKRTMWFLLFLGSIFLFILIILLMWFLIPIDVEIKLSLVLVLIIVFVFVLFWFKPRIVYYATVYQWLRLKEGSEPIKQINVDLTTSLVKSLEEKTFKLFKNTDSFSLFYRYLKDYKKITTKRGSLEIFVIIKDDLPLNHSSIHNTVNMIEETLKKDKKRFLNYVVIQVKLVSSITKELIDEADQVAFDKHGAVRVSIINVLYEQNNKNIYYLHNKSYVPNFHYEYALKLLESFF